jgi:sigma-B regulation protein RsbU (phosphoserine phosphatase)
MPAQTRMTTERELIVTFPDGKTQTIPLSKSRWSMGRSSENELSCPEDTGLSRQHLVLERDGEEWVLSDLGSKNGTFLNGVRIQVRQQLRPGDRITASHLLLIFGSSREAINQISIIFDKNQEEILSSRSLSTTSLDQIFSTQVSPVRPAVGPAREQWKTPLDAFRRAGRELSLGRPLRELFQVILDLSIEAVGAERGVLLTLEGGRLTVQASRGDGFRISTTVRDRVLQDKTSLLLKDVREDEAFRAMQSIVSQKVRSLMAVPLQTDEQVIGLIYVDSSHVGRDFTGDDLDLLTVMANVAAFRIERQRMAETEQARRRFTVELEQAAEIQRQFLPAKAPAVVGLDLAGYNSPCRTVGGDYYDFLTYPDGRVAVLVGDVCGKGMPAALLMMSLQARVQVLAQEPDRPASLVERLNRILTAASLNSRFVSFFFSVLDPVTGELVYSNAGHNPPILMRSDGKIQRLEGGGPVLGILPGICYEEKQCVIAPGDVALLYSDGVTEANNPEGVEFGEDRLVQLLNSTRHQPAEEILATITQAVHDWMAGAPAADDITLVVVRRI